MNCDPYWTTYLSALLVPVVAVLGVSIAYRQWRTAQNKLKLDLFEKRYVIYDASRGLLESVMTSGFVQINEIYPALAKMREAKWLLDDEVDKYLNKDIYVNMLKIQSLDVQLEDLPVGEARSAAVDARTALLEWLTEQYEHVLDEKFAPFLVLRH